MYHVYYGIEDEYSKPFIVTEKIQDAVLMASFKYIGDAMEYAEKLEQEELP